MNFYSFHIGDYAGATRHLSWDEDLAYRRLLDAYYMREGPLPAEKRQIYRLVVAASKAQREAVDTILAEFFELTDAGWSNSRCDEEIAAFASKRAKAQESAAKSWEARRNATAQQTQSEGNANASANAMRTQSEGNAPTTHYPLPNPSKDSGGVVARARGPDLEAKLREAAGWEREPAPKLAVTGPIEALLDAGADLELDVLPTVRSIASAAESRTSWNYFVKAIARARDTRLAAGTLQTRPKHGPASRNDRSNLSELVKFIGERQATGDADPAG